MTANGVAQIDFRRLWLPALCGFLLLAFELYLVFGSFLDAGRVLHQQEGEPIAKVFSGQKEFRYKAGGTLVWGEPEIGSAIYRMDVMATMEGSSAVIRFADESEIIIEPESMIVFEEAPALDLNGLPQPGVRSGNKIENKIENKIIVKLIHGSITRKGKGASSLYIRLGSAPDAEPLRFDEAADSIFRIIQRAHGVEVIVEAGSVQVGTLKHIGAGERIQLENGREILPPPKLRKPTIRIRERRRPVTSGMMFWLERISLIPRACAEEVTSAAEPVGNQIEVSVEFNWEPQAKANLYQVQIAEDQEFKKMILEKTTNQNSFEYQTAAPVELEFLFFHVAAVSAKGEVGEYSITEKVEIRPLEEKKPSPPVVKKQTIRFYPPVAALRVPEPAAAIPAVPEVPVVPVHTLVSAHYGISFLSRSIRNTSSNPRQVNGNGMIPSLFQFQALRYKESHLHFNLGGSFLFSRFTPQVALLKNKKPINSPLMHVYAGAMKTARGFLWGGGVAVSNRTQVSWVEPDLVGKQVLLWGVYGAILKDPSLQGRLFWQGRLSVYAIGDFGAEYVPSLRWYQWELKPFENLLTYRGAFLFAEPFFRYLKTDQTYGIHVGVGYVF